MVDHSLAPHEAGHATVAAALGVPVLQIRTSADPVVVEMDHPTSADLAKRQDLDARFATKTMTLLDYSEEGLALIADEVVIYLGGLAGDNFQPTPAAYAAMRAADDLAKVFRLIAKYTDDLPEAERDERVRTYFMEKLDAANKLIIKHPKTHFALTSTIVAGQDLPKELVEFVIQKAGEMPVPK
jgi:hypothetical protein